MKLRLLITTCLLFIIAAASYGQTCTRVIMYNGPKSTEELKTKLETSTDPLITGLSTATKQSLVTYFVFSNGIPTGLTGSDENIAALYANNDHCSAVFSAIFNERAIVTDYENRLVTQDITYDEFMSRYTQNSARYQNIGNYCKNCCNPVGTETCCSVGCSGCRDSIVLDTQTGIYYKVR